MVQKKRRQKKLLTERSLLKASFSVFDKNLFNISLYEGSIQRLKTFEPPEGYYLAFSGGKDSQVLYHLAKEAGVKFEAHFQLTSVDPPEVIYFVRDKYPDVFIDRPDITMWELIPKKLMPPTRIMRYCCQHLKENGGKNRFTLTGVRWAESAKRKLNRGLLEIGYEGKKRNKYNDIIMLNNDNTESRKLIELCAIKAKRILNPLIDWKTYHVWEYLNTKNLPHCCLYDQGFARVGCIGCPLSGTKNMLMEFQRYPKYKALYLRAFEKMIAARKAKGYPCDNFTSPQAVYDWWLFAQGKEKIAIEQEQLSFDDFSADWL